MNWAAGRDFQEPRSLNWIEISFQADATLDLVEHYVLGFNVLAILCVNPLVAKLYLNALQRKSLLLRIHAKCNGYSGSERCKQVSIGARPAVRTSKGSLLIRDKSVLTGLN